MSSEQKDQPPPYQEIAGHQGGGYGTVPTQDQCQQGGYNQAPAYPQGGYNQGPPPGIYPQPQGAGYDPSKYQGAYQAQSQGYQSVGVVVQQQPAQQVVLVGGCPACRVGVLEEDYTCLGVLCAILFFPLGILCCLAMRQRRCPSCGAVFD